MKSLPQDNRDDIETLKDSLIEHTFDFKSHIQEDSVQFAKILDKLDYVIKGQVEQSKDIQKLSEKVNPVVQWFDNITFGKRMILGFLTILVTITTLIGGGIGIIIAIRSWMK